jgi:hypothetical protein|tara:strand:+ start:414 stop:821 length:408 start_codon:yes stop_codon:yes gene_type:complete
MEIIYFILGIVFAMSIYGVVVIQKVKTSYLEVSDLQERMQMDVTKFIMDTENKVNKSLEDTNQIKEELEKDSYKSFTELSKQFLGLKEFSDVTSRNFIAHQKLTERNNSRLINDVNALKRHLKAINQDPNMLNRY